MKKMFILGAMVCVLGMMTACKSRTNNESTNDTLQRVAIPDHAPNIQYLQIIDSLGSFGWFEMDTLWLMYDNNYTRAVKPRYINGVPVVWLSNGENGAMEGDKLHSRRYIEYGYESHGGSYLTVSVCDVHYDGDGELIGVVHAYYPIDFLDSSLNAQQKIQEQPKEVIFEVDENRVRQRYTDAEMRAKESVKRAGEM